MTEPYYVDKKFRSHWSARIRDPTPRHFFPVAQPAVPMTRERAPIPEPVEVPKRERMNGPPPGADVKFNIRDRYNDWRGYIAGDGSCYNNVGDVIGYIEGDDAGSVTEDFLGTINADNQVSNALDDVVARLDPGRVTIHTVPDDDLWAEIDNSGCVKAGEDVSYCGQFEGFTFHDMKIITLYLVLIDPNMLNPEG
eukprot:TRINITY_DN273_c0_g1_i1.p2 TRINITY_DN273_c0_g1~~TRINITY_DN273_c0_g1_i1.p2  ORF type:complete len:215 (+),score=59.23 TRINITY_DN273_c0_g1_i1:62-646(+)